MKHLSPVFIKRETNSSEGNKRKGRPHYVRCRTYGYYVLIELVLNYNGVHTTYTASWCVVRRHFDVTTTLCLQHLCRTAPCSRMVLQPPVWLVWWLV